MRYYFTIIFWFLLTSYGLIAIYGTTPLPCPTTSYFSFFLGLTFMGMLLDFKDVVESHEKPKRYFVERGERKK